MATGTIVRRAVKIGLVSLGALLLASQLVPYGRDHANPPVVQEPAWDQASTRTLARRACFDCHSNETRWPWYSHVAPISWLVQSDVERGRRELNFSEWNRRYEEAEDSASTVLKGEMPPKAYVLLHPSAALSSAEQRALARGLAAIVGGSPAPSEDEENEGHESAER